VITKHIVTEQGGADQGEAAGQGTGDGAAGGDAPGAGNDECELAGDRAAVRWEGPYDGDPRLHEDQGGAEGGPPARPRRTGADGELATGGVTLILPPFFQYRRVERSTRYGRRG
jgi:hypothetical protein